LTKRHVILKHYINSTSEINKELINNTTFTQLIKKMQSFSNLIENKKTNMFFYLLSKKYIKYLKYNIST